MEQKHNDRIISMTYQHAWHVITRRIKINHNNDIQRNVLESDLVVKAIEEVASTHLYRHHHHHHHHNHQESDRIRLTSSIETSATRLSKEYLHLLQRYRHKATQHLERIRSCVSSSLLRISGWILYRLLCKLFVAVQFNTNQINYIRNRQRENIPIIYLLRHRSYLDYLLISFILSMNDLNPPLIALDENRFAPFVGNLIRGLGAYFFSHKKNDPLYSAVMRSYIEENLRKGNSMEFHLKSSHNQTEFRLLSIILDIMDSDPIQTDLIV
ncbi:glycerol-3-phosphate acyltransferase-like protein [Sarcoptes scabiei]|uniref:Glycerol-3-phosphate acyltransferase-like protein n=1 Tax=Sarcoptes scabiei TaxID=52283 RepID=A0A132AC10_SARSC|nr:glycerol-3-phosphate acyltransferase-like protein [Sarcoptes scabiei]